MTVNSYACITLCCLICGFLPRFAVAESWPVKTFTVVRENPSRITWDDVATAHAKALIQTDPGQYQRHMEYAVNLENKYEQQLRDEDTAPAVSDEVIEEIEGWLGKMANVFEQMGFRKPFYTDVDSSLFGDQKSYKVYLYHYTGGAPAGMLSPCSTGVDKFYIRMDSGRNIRKNRLTTKAYQDLAHELFHAVQNSYDLFRNNCNLGGWISEGTAEAVGIEMARRYANKAPGHICQIGLRRYDRTLHTSDENKVADAPCSGLKLDYQAQSFWQFLGEYATRRKSIATEEFAVPDFRYLHGFFETQHEVGSRQTEFAWLDKALRTAKTNGSRTAFGIGLDRAYSRFAGTFASYWKPGRTALYEDTSGGGDLADKEKQWLKWVYKDCPEVLITRDATASVDIDIAPVAARCIQMNFDTTGRFKLTFHASGDNQGIDLDSLMISTDGGKKIIRRDRGEQNPDRLGHFSIDAKSGIPQYLIVSNVARDPAQTAGVEVKLHLEPGFIDTSKAKADKAPSDDSGSTPGKELANAWASRSWSGSARQRERSPCSKPFEVSPCGPTTHLDLQIVSDTAELLDEVSQPALVRSERMVDVLGAIVERGAGQLPMDLSKALREIQSLDGWRVRITLQQIQPGFTGSVDNAHIRVARAINPDGSANDDWRAVGPAWRGSCQDGYHPASGIVSFTTFTENSARGSFSAELSDDANSQPCQAVPIDTPINGDFVITRVDLGNNAPSPGIPEEEILEDVIEDTNELLPGFVNDDMREHLRETLRSNREAQESREQATQQNDRTTVSDFDRCGCDCEMEAQACGSEPVPECCSLCAPVFTMCKRSQGDHQAAQNPVEPADQQVESQALRQRYEAYVDTIAVNAVVKQQLMGAFDALKTIDEKRLLMMGIPK